MELLPTLHVDHLLLPSPRDGESGIVVFALESLLNNLMNKSILSQFPFFFKCMYSTYTNTYTERGIIPVCTVQMVFENYDKHLESRHVLHCTIPA